MSLGLETSFWLLNKHKILHFIFKSVENVPNNVV